MWGRAWRYGSKRSSSSSMLCPIGSAPVLRFRLPHQATIEQLRACRAASPPSICGSEAGGRFGGPQVLQATAGAKPAGGLEDRRSSKHLLSVCCVRLRRTQQTERRDTEE